MFNLFKKKIELKTTKSIMDSIHEKSGVKIGTKIQIPKNYECLIYHNSKYYATLLEGEYEITQSLLPELFKKQNKNLKKKRIKFIAHYINISPQKIEIKIKKNKYIINFIIMNSQNFAEFILLYTYKTDQQYSYYSLKSVFEECLKSFSIDNVDNINKHLNKLGIKILNINSNTSSIFNNNENVGDKNENIDNSNTIPTCPNCHAVLKIDTVYCLNCGYKLK